MSLADELQKLQQLRDAGTLTEEEFQQTKARLIREDQAAQAWAQGHPAPAAPLDPEREGRQWGLFLHLAQYAGFVVPLGGIILPIVLWQMKKDQLPGVDAHGKVVVNWMISFFIYVLVCVPLCFILIGIPILALLILVGLIYPIVGGLKANDGEVWKYPGSITFLS